MATDVVISAPVPFERMPIEYERAYGGMDDAGVIVEHRNPAGVGVARSAGDLVGRPAPQIEHPERPHRTARDKHAPIGCGAILPHWSPRRELAGTFDDLWRATRMPLCPLDFDVRHNNAAHPALIFDPPLVAGDRVAVRGMAHDTLALSLPRVPVAVRARYDDGDVDVHPAVDTVLIDVPARRMEIVMRATFPVGRGRRALRELRASTDE